MKRKMKKAKSVSMMGKSNEPFMKKAKKPEADDKPHSRPGPASTNKNMGTMKSPRVKRLTGTLI
jgi:hypothetical protein